MFDKFLRLFSKQNLMEQSYQTTVKMLRFDQEMFIATMNVLRDKDTAELPFDIYQKDKEINKFEREIRRDVLTHLSVSGPHNISAGMVLVSIVIDVERIGDFTKNIAELSTAHPEKLKGGIYEDELKQCEEKVLKRFEFVIEALESAEQEQARKVLSEYRDLNRKCDQFLYDIISEKDSSIGVHDAVVLALYFRYLKRIGSHLMNIASAMVNPFPRIGFRDKTQDEDKE